MEKNYKILIDLDDDYLLDNIAVNFPFRPKTIRELIDAYDLRISVETIIGQIESWNKIGVNLERALDRAYRYLKEDDNANT